MNEFITAQELLQYNHQTRNPKLSRRSYRGPPDITHPRITESLNLRRISPSPRLQTPTTKMAAPLPFTFRRAAATVSSTALKAPTRQTTTTAYLQRRCLSAATRALGSSQRRVSPVSTELDSPKKQLQSQHGLWTRSQGRWFSDESSPRFRLWGFEDVRPTPRPNQKHQKPSKDQN